MEEYSPRQGAVKEILELKNRESTTAVLTDPWTDKIQKHIEKLRNDSAKKSEEHSLAGHHFRKLEIRWRLPSIVIPLAFSPLVLMVGYLDDKSCGEAGLSDYVAALGLLLTSIFTGVSGFFTYGNRSSTHHTYSAQYNSIVTDIEAEIIKKPKFRISADLFVTTMKMKYDNLVFGEPVVPLSIEKFVSNK